MVDRRPPHRGVLGRPLARRPFLVGLSTLAFGAVAATSATPACSQVASFLPAAHWRRKFDSVAAATRREYLVRSTSTDSWDFYDLAYGIDAYTSMAEATIDGKYLDQALEFVNNLLGSARPSSTLRRSAFKDDFLGWASERSDTVGQEVPLFESYSWRYVTRLLRVIRGNPDFYGDPSYRRQYDRILAFSQRHIFDKWYSRGPQDNIFRDRTHMASHWAFIAMNLEQLTADESRRRQYRQVVNAVDTNLPNHRSSLRDQMQTTMSGAYVWSDIWGGTRPQDVSHGNNVISYVVASRDLGQRWTGEDLTRFCRTLKLSIWPQEGVFSEYVDGSREGNGLFSDGFAKLGRYDSALQGRLDNHTVQDAQFFGAMAVNSARLATAPPNVR